MTEINARRMGDVSLSRLHKGASILGALMLIGGDTSALFHNDEQ